MYELLTLPDERLRKKSLPVTQFDAKLHDVVRRLEAAMLAGAGGVGIAAPQLGVLQRIIIVDCSLGLHKNKNHGRLIMVNPEIIEHDGEALGREGCLSVPEWVGTVPRARRITVRYQGLDGQVHELSTKAFEARVIQHEIDHLDGILFIDKVVSTKDLIRRMDV
ncbi:peptide deformylase [Ghiorsea bivora]|uniref:peptide deformylase n=1 Tax=Ghiorsea bivora TaxID=1485545 RepID=UPI0005704689|nr:peptide deformylase [Ghiorsea bivora]